MTADELLTTLDELHMYWNLTRGVGHTTAMRQGSDYIPCIVVAHDMRFARQLSKQPRTLHEVSQGALRGLRMPLVVDHYALGRLLFGAAEEIRRLNAAVAAAAAARMGA